MAKRAIQLNAEGEEDSVAKRVYLQTLSAPPVPDAVEAPPSPPRHATQSVETGKPMVKDMILTVLRDAHPNGLSAEQIKGKAFLRYQEHINPNTLTVSLGRYSKPKPGEPVLAKCVGRIWYYVHGAGTVPARAPELALLNGGKHAAE